MDSLLLLYVLYWSDGRWFSSFWLDLYYLYVVWKIKYVFIYISKKQVLKNFFIQNGNLDTVEWIPSGVYKNSTWSSWSTGGVHVDWWGSETYCEWICTQLDRSCEG